MRARRMNLDLDAIEKLLARRKEARDRKDFAASDALRDDLANLGIAVRDTPQGQVWDIE